MINKVFLMGRPTGDPEVRYTQGSEPLAIARYTLAVDRRRSNNNEEHTADFIRCVAFGRNAEFVERYIRKGMKIAIVGRIQTGSYTNGDGQRVYTTEVVVEEHEFAESRNASGGNGGGFNGGDYSVSAPSGAGDGFMNIPEGIDEELPFN